MSDFDLLEDDFDEYDDSCRRISAVISTPGIDKRLKALYAAFFKKQYYIISATISDENDKIVPDPDILQKQYGVSADLVTKELCTRLANEYMERLQSNSITEYKKPRFIFINNMVKPVLVTFEPKVADRDKILWFEGTFMNLKAQVKCNLPATPVGSYEELIQLFVDLNQKLHDKILDQQMQKGAESRS